MRKTGAAEECCDRDMQWWWGRMTLVLCEFSGTANKSTKTHGSRLVTRQFPLQIRRYFLWQWRQATGDKAPKSGNRRLSKYAATEGGRIAVRPEPLFQTTQAEEVGTCSGDQGRAVRICTHVHMYHAAHFGYRGKGDETGPPCCALRQRSSTSNLFPIM